MSASPATAATSSGSLSGLNATPTWSPCSRAALIVAGTSSTASKWNVMLFAACRRDRCEVLGRVLGHQVHVDRAVVAVDERRDRLEDDRPHRDRLDEVAVADVEMKDAALGAQQLLDLRPQVGEVGCVQRRLDFSGSRPGAPGHRRDVTRSGVR